MANPNKEEMKKENSQLCLVVFLCSHSQGDEWLLVDENRGGLEIWTLILESTKISLHILFVKHYNFFL